MEAFVPVIKYIFVVAAGVEVALILRALVVLALQQARAAAPPARLAEE